MDDIKEIPIYLFLGFLDSGKTKFIQETFEDPRFDDTDEKTLLIVLEEGEETYSPERFAVKKYAIETVEPDEMSLSAFSALMQKHDPARVVIEYNGMMQMSDFFNAMPDGWMIAQMMVFFDSTTFLSYNQNMRQLVFDKVQYADMVVFNRFKEGYSKEEFHKIIRGMTRRPNMVYEYEDGRAEYDDLPDPLPYDIEAPIIQIGDGDYAFFYRDLVEETKKYAGKMVHLKGMVATDKKMKAGTIVVGRHVMTCCEADIQFSGLVCLHASTLPLKTRDWVTITARIDIQYHKIYGQKGPVLKVTALEYAEAPEQELATFY